MAERQFSLGALAEALGAVLEGDPARIVTGIAPLEAAGPDHVSFLTDARYRAQASRSRAGAVVLAADAEPLATAMLRVKDPGQAMIRLLDVFHPRPVPTPGIHPAAVIADGARVDTTASVGALAVVERGAVIGAAVRVHALAYVGAGVEIGEGSEIHPHAVLEDGVRLGRRVIVHAGAVVGGDGFGYLFTDGAHRKIPQVGTVIVEDDVEIGSNATIDRAMLGATVIGRGTKIDNLVQVGHNVTIGEHSILVSQVGISGSSHLGRGVVLAGQVGIADHVTIGDGAMVAAQSGIHADVEPGAKLLGTPARPLMHAKRIYLTEDKLPDLARKLRDLEQRLDRLDGGGKAGRDG
ncbi:MAG: UDP-3-O-(3-hydroxymyristoyl)glucosamine N-acyltransferase [Candidatus Rokubacteria bacterium]|nr:UDP-3-O-(3-hydroxymyristoyl)glucosamine N-acyltransferase [Candidatus Rokubacteria bacterium]